jgi:phosphatidylglycerophosphatase A
MLGPLGYWGSVIALTGAGIWASEQAAQRLGDDDPSSVVIDEVVGALIALGLTRPTSGKLLALLLFRAFDILKPGVIDRVQKARPPGVGIMADDVLASLAAGVTARLLSRRALRAR